jgi:hypothetical protein
LARDSVRTSASRHCAEIINGLTIAGKHSQGSRGDPHSCRAVILDDRDSPAARSIPSEVADLARTCPRAITWSRRRRGISCGWHCLPSCSAASPTTQQTTAPASTGVFERRTASVRYAVKPAQPSRNLFGVSALLVAEIKLAQVASKRQAPSLAADDAVSDPSSTVNGLLRAATR